MKRAHTRLFFGRYIILGLICMGLVMGAAGSSARAAEEEKQQIHVLFTHDLHSHINSFDTLYQGENVNIGGFARLQTLIRRQLEEDADTLIVDAGDFSMGTLFQTIYETQAPELRLLGEMGVAATTLGNHEFDYRSEGLNRMLLTAAESGDTRPDLLLCNVDWTDMDAEQEKAREAFEYYGVKDYCMVERNGVRIALIGVFGEDALECAPTCILSFKDPVQAVSETVARIEANEEADMIVCLSHSGTNEDKDKSEDEQLAEQVPRLDLIISGHTHTTLEEPIVHGDTAIVSAGEYGKTLGTLTMTRTENGRWSIEDYELIPVTQEIEPDALLQEKIDEFAAYIDTDYLSYFGYRAEQILAYNPYSFSTVEDLGASHIEHNLGNILADAYVYAVEHADGYDGHPVDVAVVPSGTVRDTYVQGNITVENVFNSFSLGIGEDGIPGYPLISVYLTGKELRTIAEIDASVSDYMPTARLYMSGMEMKYNPNRLLLNKTTGLCLASHRLWQTDAPVGEPKEEIEDDRLYRVVADLYSGQMLSAVTDMSYGILSIVPKDENGVRITDFADCIVYDGAKELKAWAGIAGYLSSFEKNGEGISQIPEYYSEVRGRKIREDAKDIYSLLRQPNEYAVIMMAAAAAILLLVVLLVRLAGKGIQRMKEN